MSSFVFEWGLASDDTKDVVVSLKSASDPTKTLPVQEWRVERTDAAILVMGNRAEFKGQLPAGDYNVAVKSRIDSKSPIVKLKGTIKVTSDAQVQTSSAMIVGQ